MLTVDYDRLGLRPGELLLDVGCGAGRHAYEALRRGARVVAYDLDASEVKDTATVLSAMQESGESAESAESFEADGADGSTTSAPLRLGAGWAVNGDALHVPFPDATFDRIIASEVLEHIPADSAAISELTRVLRPGGTLAVTVPRWGPELVNWALADAYHETPGGHIRIYRAGVLAGRLRASGLRVTGRGYAHALHSPYWWLRCAVGLERDDHPFVRAYHQVLVWDIERKPVVSLATRAAEVALNPIIGKSMVLYAALDEVDELGRRDNARDKARDKAEVHNG